MTLHLSNRTTNIIAIILLVVMFFSAVFSLKDDTATFDELAHIPAGYSYLSQQDYRINPEHPPLIKDLSALPLMFLNLNFPIGHSSWIQKDGPVWWLQFDLGTEFLYHSGNNPDQIVFWSRIPMVFLLMLLGFLIFHWTRKLGGNYAGLFSLVLFTFSPTFLAHGRLVTTDVGATIGVVLATYFWLNFLKNPIKRNIILAGVAFGIAMLLKFSLALLIPFFAVITLAYSCLRYQGIKGILKYIGLAIIAGLVAAVLVWLVYQFHIWNYPAERQLRDTQTNLSQDRLTSLVNLTIWMADKPVVRPYAQYMQGLLMATQRTMSGNTTYFLGMVSASSWWYYFPVVYFLKVPLAFHVLTLMSLFSLILLIRQGKIKLFEWLREYFVEFSLVIFLLIYWFTSVTGNLNIGVRHILPVFPFTYILVVLAITKGIKALGNVVYRKTAIATVLVLLAWYVSSSLSVYPFYLTHFNEIAGGPANGYKYAVDSNLDWGQDLKRLKKWTEENGIEKIYIDYFGGGDAQYYFGEKYQPWQRDWNPEKIERDSYLAVSASTLQGGRAKAVSGFDQPADFYKWLNDYQTVAVIGNSIFVYYID